MFLGACSFITACFHATANAPFGSSFSLRHPNLAIASASRARRRGDLVEKVTTGSPAGGVGPAGCGSGLGVVGSRSGLLCLLRCIVCLLVLLLCACFRLSLPLLGLFIFWLKAPCSGSFVVPAEGTALPLGLGDLNNLFLLVGLGLFILSRNSVSNPFAGYQP